MPMIHFYVLEEIVEWSSVLKPGFWGGGKKQTSFCETQIYKTELVLRLKFFLYIFKSAWHRGRKWKVGISTGGVSNVFGKKKIIVFLPVLTVKSGCWVFYRGSTYQYLRALVRVSVLLCAYCWVFPLISKSIHLTSKYFRSLFYSDSIFR